MPSLHESGKSWNPCEEQTSHQTLVGAFPEGRLSPSWGLTHSYNCTVAEPGASSPDHCPWPCSAPSTEPQPGTLTSGSPAALAHSKYAHISGKNILDRWKFSTIFTVAGTVKVESMIIDYLGQQKCTGTRISRIRVSPRISFEFQRRER